MTLKEHIVFYDIKIWLSFCSFLYHKSLPKVEKVIPFFLNSVRRDEISLINFKSI